MKKKTSLNIMKGNVFYIALFEIYCTDIPKQKIINIRYCLFYFSRFIYEQSKYLHPNNYILINAKMKLGLLYGNYGKYKLLTMSRPNIDRKIQVKFKLSL